MIVAWDFDGVLNANVQGGRFIWTDGFEEHTGQSLKLFNETVFGPGFRDVIIGKVDLADRVQVWVDDVGYAPGAEAVIDYWFARDFFPDAGVLTLVDRLSAAGVGQVMATNNEHRRTGRIADHPEFGPRFAQVFAAGPMGVCKPDAAFFAAVTTDLGVAASEIVLVDDLAQNVDAARQFGWKAVLFNEGTDAAHLTAELSQITGHPL